jgi:hypothetical protein
MDTSPGFGFEPPPASETLLQEWCGDLNGLIPQVLKSNPVWLIEATAADSSDSFSAIKGKIPGSLEASSVLPVPGGPTISKLWLPAAATSSARLGPGSPITSARSGVFGGR